jgi:DNA-binding transcriptional ArsR family regulator/precorrin-6B methylase 2
VALSLEASAELLRALADPTRVRLLRLLQEDELTVAELVRVTGLPQPRVSTHLARLREAGLVRDRRSGAASFYAIAETGASEMSRSLCELLRRGTDDPVLRADRDRAREVVSARGQSWADSVAGQMERHYSPGRTWESALRALLGLLQLGDVIDIASGDGALAELLAARARSVVCVDISPRVVAAGQRRLAHLPHVSFEVGDMHALGLTPQRFDAALLMHALSYAHDPAEVIREAARVLRPGGRLVAVALHAHTHEAAARAYGHVQAGFEVDALHDLAQGAGLAVELCARTSRERRAPHFETITLHARKPSKPHDRDLRGED